MKLALFVVLLGCASSRAGTGTEAESESEAEAEAESESESEAEAESESESESESEEPCADAPDWSCVGNVKPLLPLESSGTALYATTLLDIATLAAMADVTIKACARTDMNCTAPLDETITNMDGGFDLTLPLEAATTGFDGYLELTGGEAYPTLAFFNPPVRADFTPVNVLGITEANFDLFALASFVTLDPERGHMGGLVFECGNCVAAGASLASEDADEASTRVYINDQFVPVQGALETYSNGAGGWFNVPAESGMATMSATLVDTGDLIGSETVLVRAGYFSFTTFVPESTR